VWGVVVVDEEVAVDVRLAGRVLAVAELVEPDGMCLVPDRASESLSDRVCRAESGRDVAAALLASARNTDAASPC
jgi:pyridoxine 5'-phosphate synthase PdxJ